MRLNFTLARGNPLSRNPRLPEATALLKGWTRRALNLGDDAVVCVNELTCSQPDCPPRSTVVLVLRANTPALRLSIHKALVDIGEEDVIAARLDGADLLLPRGRTGDPAP